MHRATLQWQDAGRLWGARSLAVGISNTLWFGETSRVCMFISRGGAIRGLTGVQCGKRRGPRCGVCVYYCSTYYKGASVSPCDALSLQSQQYLEEEAGYGQADCSIIPGTRELHGPESHRSLALLPGASLRSARGLSLKYERSSQLLATVP